MTFPPLAGNLPLYAVVAVVFLLMISVLVFAHEAGHYLFARLFNMGVEEFAIGFGKKPILIYGRRKYVIPLKPGDERYLGGHAAAIGDAAADDGASRPGKLGQVAQRIGSMEGGEKPDWEKEAALEREKDESERVYSTLVQTPNGPELHEQTYFTIRPIPAGGFVRIKGMLPEEDGSETKIPGGFYSKPPWQRLIVLLAGPAFSVLAGILILVPVYMIDGITRPDQKPVLGKIEARTPAARAGLKQGDLILAIDGQPVTQFYDILKQVTSSGGRTLDFEYQRGGKLLETKVTPALDAYPTYVLDRNLDWTGDVARQWHLGTSIKSVTTYPSFSVALGQAAMAPVITVEKIAQMFQKPARAKNSLSGPGQIVGTTAIAVQEGVIGVLELAGLLSISVGIFNLFPFPPLDGGQMAIALAEMVRGGRRLSMQIQGLVSLMGLLAVSCLVLCALYFDFQQITKRIPKDGPVQAAPAPAPKTSPAVPNHRP